MIKIEKRQTQYFAKNIYKKNTFSKTKIQIQSKFGNKCLSKIAK